MKLMRATRVRIEAVKIRCNDDECIDLRSGGSVHLRNCTIYEYNSGAGGSNAIRGSDAVLFVEGCVFEGMSGRAAGHQSGGDAFDLRGTNFLFVKDTTFIDNDEVARVTFPAVFDGCVSKGSTPWESGILPYAAGMLFVRNNKIKVSKPEWARESAHFTGDAAFVRALLGEGKPLEGLSRDLAEAIRATRNLPYWIGLLRHADAEIRKKAARRVETLTGRTVVLVKEEKGKVDPEDLDRWIRELDHEDFETREKAMKELERAGTEALEKLEEVVKSGTLEQKIRARRLLATIERRSPVRFELEYARLIRWYEENRERLVWDAKAGKYIPKD
jgi:hypothetical protein